MQPMCHTLPGWLSHGQLWDIAAYKLEAPDRAGGGKAFPGPGWGGNFLHVLGLAQGWAGGSTVTREPGPRRRRMASRSGWLKARQPAVGA